MAEAYCVKDKQKVEVQNAQKITMKNGKPATTDRADYTLIGVQLPEGARKVSLIFDSPEYHTGKAITLVAIFLSLVVLAGGLVIEKRKVA